MRVIIIGGGLGGLCLAHGLRGAGIDVAVHESDPSPFARGQGYRIYLDPGGNAALKSCLPDDVLRLYSATCGKKLGTTPALLDENLTALFDREYQDRYASKAPADDSVVDRLTFRQTLTVGLGEIVHYGKRFTHFEDVPGGVVRAHFADGSSAEGDVLVGADGIGSAVRSQLLPKAETFDTALRLIYGRTPLTPARRELLPDFAIATGPSSRSMVLGVFEFENDPRRVADSLGLAASFTEVGDYVMWGLVVPAGDVGEESLTDTALKLTSGWHPGVHDLIEGSAPSSLNLLSLCSSIPMDAWRTRNVTLLGDAAHTMFPAGGGTAIALRDAAELRQALETVTTGTSALLPALATYESAMRSYSASAVRESYLMAERLGARPWPTS